MEALLGKLLLTPMLIGAASLAGRRWGPAISGWLVGFPFTSAPVALFLALGYGTGFAAAAAVGIMAAAISQAAFGLAYAWVAHRHGWPGSIVAGSLAFAASTVVLQRVSLTLAPLLVAVVAILILALRLMPSPVDRPAGKLSTPRWDLGARMVVATACVLLLTGVAPALGARLTGLLAPFPLYAAILTVFAHRLQGPAAAAAVLRGLLHGLFAFAGFFLMLAPVARAGGYRAGVRRRRRGHPRAPGRGSVDAPPRPGARSVRGRRHSLTPRPVRERRATAAAGGGDGSTPRGRSTPPPARGRCRRPPGARPHRSPRPVYPGSALRLGASRSPINQAPARISAVPSAVRRGRRRGSRWANA